MKCYFHLLLWLFSFAFAGCTFSDAEVNKLTKKEIKKGWKLLMDGESLNNWKIFNGGEVIGWRIENGVLYNSGGSSEYGGDIITKDEYQNFELSIEWKISPQSNSGIFFHVQEGIVNKIHESGPEYQLIDDKGWQEELQELQYSGANYGMHAPRNLNVLPIEQWNKTRLIVNGPHVEHWLNGKKVVEYELWSDEWYTLKQNSKWENMPHYGEAKKGHIGLQDHGGLTLFRNIKIRELD
jgi:hypothetical protein